MPTSSLPGTVQGIGWSKDSPPVSVVTRQGEENLVIQTCAIYLVSENSPWSFFFVSIDLDPRPTWRASSGSKSTLTTLGWCLGLGQLAEFSEKPISEVRYYPAKKRRKKKSEVLFCTILKNRSWGTAIWWKCLSMVLSRARYELLHLRRHPFSHGLTCQLPSAEEEPWCHPFVQPCCPCCQPEREEG